MDQIAKVIEVDGKQVLRFRTCTEFTNEENNETVTEVQICTLTEANGHTVEVAVTLASDVDDVLKLASDIISKFSEVEARSFLFLVEKIETVSELEKTSAVSEDDIRGIFNTLDNTTIDPSKIN